MKCVTLALSLVLLLLAACDPLAPAATPQVIVITPIPSSTPVPTRTPAPTRTPFPTPTPDYTPTATPFPCGEETGQVIAVDRFRSETAGENLRYRVYLPPCYFETGRRYPVVFLLHGAANDERQWENIGTLAALDQGLRLGALPPMIAVMPYTGSIGSANTFPPAPSYETVLLDELLPAIDRDFCTWSSRAYRAIGGISRGGFWAYSIALRHPDVFGIVGGHSAAFSDDLRQFPPAFNPLEIALNGAFLTDAGLRMYLDNGTSDFAGINLQLFSSRLSSRGIAHTYVINPVGEHNDTYWSAHISEYLAFYGRMWPKVTAELPPCDQPSP